MTTVLAVIIDTAIATGLALLVCRALRGKPAALRHVVLAASLAAVALAPVLETTVPQWDLPLLSAPPQIMSSGTTLSSEAAPTIATTVTPAPAPRLTWPTVLAVAWGIGFAVVIGGLLAGLFRLVVMTRRCRPLQSGIWRERAAILSSQYGLTRAVQMLECPDRALLLTWGVFRPRIIVPRGADSWTVDRVDIVLAHELTHIARRDWAVQMGGEVLRALYWFNPLVWMTCRRLRHESEQACDDAVLRRGLSPVEYSTHLLAIARQLLASGRGWAAAPAVADPSTLERRIAGMLNETRNRAPLTRTAGVLTTLGMLAAAIPVAAVTLTERFEPAPLSVNLDRAVASVAPALAPPPAAVVPSSPVRRAPRAAAAAAAAPAQQRPGSVAGTLRDASGAMLPGVQVTLTDAVSGKGPSTVSDPNGAFRFRDVAPASYRLEARLPGFATLLIELAVASGEDVQRSLTLRVGSLTETVTVTCVSGAAEAARYPQVLAFGERVATPRLFTVPRTWSFGQARGQAPPAQPPLRIGGQIAAPRQTKRVQPVCPSTPIGSGGAVILEATLGPDGMIKDVKVLRSAPGRPDIDQSAIDAIRQWEYTPTRLNNVPVPVIMTVTVVYAPN